LTNGRGHTALTSSCEQGHLAAVELLLERRSDPNLMGGVKATRRGVDTPLIAACRGNHVEIVDCLLGAGANANQQEPLSDASANLDGWTALIETACCGQHILVRKLIDAHADPNLNLKGNAGPIYFSACNGHFESTQILLDAGARIDEADRSNGRNGLWWAAKEGHTSVVRLLLENRADPLHQLHERAERAGTSPVHMASQHGHSRCVEALLESGGSTTQADKNGDLPAHIACREGHEEVVKVLLELGDLSQRAHVNHTGRTPIQVAQDAGHDRLVDLWTRISRLPPPPRSPRMTRASASRP